MARNLRFVGENKGVPGDDWWEWHVDGVPPEDWRQDEMRELVGHADWLLAERFRGVAGESRKVSYTFTREAMSANLRRAESQSAYR